jgi:transposase
MVFPLVSLSLEGGMSMPTIHYIVRLSAEERAFLEELIRKGKTQTYRIRHAQILLKADANGENWSTRAIAEAFNCIQNTVFNIRQRFVEGGVEAALERKKQARPSHLPLLDGEKEAKLIAMSCREPPEGRCRWTLRLLAERLVEEKVVPSVSHETVRQTLKKTSFTRIRKGSGAFRLNKTRNS